MLAQLQYNVHGDVKRYPRAEVLVAVQEQLYLLNVAGVDNLPDDMILGRDLPVLCDLVDASINVDAICIKTKM